MSNWEPGDLALRVGPVSPEKQARFGVRQGGVYTVTEVVFSPTQGIGLRLVGVDHSKSRSRLKAVKAAGFIKITPGADVVGFEEPRRVPVKRERQDA